MPRCERCRCDLRVGEVAREHGAPVYRYLCANRRCANYRKIVLEQTRPGQAGEPGEPEGQKEG